MALVFNRDFHARYGEAVPVAPGVRRVTARNPGPFTFCGTNTFLIGTGEIAVLDPGPADVGHIAAVMEAVGSAEVRHILVSHAHRDHSPGARLLQERTGAPMLAAANTREQAKLASGTGLDAGIDTEFAPDTILHDGDLIEGNGYCLRAIATPGHAADHLAFALEGADLLFSGDHVMAWATTVVAPPDGSMRDYMRSLQTLLARPETLYFPAHGGEIRDAHAFVRSLVAHRRMREAAILDQLRGADRSVSELVADIYRDLDPSLRGAAAMSTLAHLEHLLERGEVVTEGRPGLGSRYSLGGVSSSAAAGASSGAGPASATGGGAGSSTGAAGSGDPGDTGA